MVLWLGESPSREIPVIVYHSDLSGFISQIFVSNVSPYKTYWINSFYQTSSKSHSIVVLKLGKLDLVMLQKKLQESLIQKSSQKPSGEAVQPPVKMSVIFYCREVIEHSMENRQGEIKNPLCWIHLSVPANTIVPRYFFAKLFIRFVWESPGGVENRNLIP